MNISRIVLGLLLIIGAGGALAGGTSAFFSDSESSNGNSFTAGEIDLKIDNDSYYNGNRCTFIEATTTPGFYWQGASGFPVPGSPCETSFPASDLDKGFVFFNFNDVKPDDEGEDTISLHVQNDAWACMDLTLTSNDDRSSNEPELGAGDAQDIPGDAWDGELGETLEFFWWADDGDNVYEDNEQQISEGVMSLIDLAPQGDSFQVALADADGNVWGGTSPLPANETVYIAKAWCMGNLTLNPVAAGQGVNPQVATGVTCDGEDVTNVAQTDGVELNVVFTAVQARHNDDFRCEVDNGGGDPEEEATLAVNKILTASTAGIDVSDFELHIVGPSGDIVVGDNIPQTGLIPGVYTVSEVVVGDVAGKTFTTTFGGACDPNTHQVTLADGDNFVCTITNVENEPVSLLNDGFGTTDVCDTDITAWDENAANSCVNGTVAKNPGAGDDTVSPQGGRFALLSGSNGYICRSVNAAGLENLNLKYYWRGDSEADPGETGSVSFYTGGTCAAPLGLATTSAYSLTSLAWSPQLNVNLPASLNNSSFLIRFTADTNGGNESFRVDGVTLTGEPI